jgi:hypothetical protein
VERSYSAGGKRYRNWGFKDLLAATWALICEAEERGDYITLLQLTRRWEKDYDHFWTTELNDRKSSELFNIQFYKRDGTPATITSDRKHGQYGRSPDKKQLITNPTEVVWNYNIVRNYDEQINNVTQGYWVSGSGEWHPPQFIRSQDYDAIKRYWLGMPNFGSDDYQHSTITASVPIYLWWYVRKLSMSWSTTKKTNVIFIWNSQYPSLLQLGWKYLEEIHPRANVWFFDIGERDRTKEYFGEQAPKRIVNGRETEWPLLVGKNGKPLMNYVYVDDISLLTKRILEVTRRLGR